MEDFDDVWELYSQVDGNSDFEYLSRAMFKFRRLQSIPKSCFLMFLLKLHPGPSQGDTSNGTFDDFCGFLRFEGAPRLPFGFFCVFPIFCLRSENHRILNTFGRGRRHGRAPPEPAHSENSAQKIQHALLRPNGVRQI